MALRFLDDLKLFPEKNMSIPPIHYHGSLEMLPYFSINLEAGHLEAHLPPSRLLVPPVKSPSFTLRPVLGVGLWVGQVSEP